MKSIGKTGALAISAALMLAGCGSFDGKRDSGTAAAPTPAPAIGPAVADGPVKIGAPYSIAGVTYSPADVTDYDEVGYASWYGDELAGRPTANGENYNPAGISAAHKTLPLPSYVEVTALDTGRTILVRLNDRGPMVSDRLIDLSRGAAEQLGLKNSISGVRVRRTNPPVSERTQLRRGEAVPERLGTPDSLLAILRSKLTGMPSPAAIAAGVAKPTTATAPAKPTVGKPGSDRFIVEGPGAKPATPAAAAKPAPAPALTTGSSYAVQVAAFSSQSRANAAAKSVGGTVSKAGNIWRVRMGPFASEAEALSAQSKAKAKGFRDAQIQRDR